MVEEVENGVGGLDLNIAKAMLSSSSTSLRIAYLQQLIGKIDAKELDDSTISSLLENLLDTYSYYRDRSSRQAVKQCLRSIFSSQINPDSLASFLRSLEKEAAKPGIAPTNAFVLVEWCGLLLEEFAGRPLWEDWGLVIVQAHSQVLELCLSSLTRSGVAHSALVITRRAFRKVFAHASTGPDAVGKITAKLTAKSSASNPKSSVMLGVVAGVCARMPSAEARLESNKTDIYSFYTREIIGSRIALPPHIANGLHDFFLNFTTIDDLEKILAPSIEKSLLRAPEVVLDDLLTPLFNSLSTSLDTSKTLRSSLLKPFLSNLKSSNAIIRNGVLKSFAAAVSRSKNDVLLREIADEIVAPLKAGKIPAAEQRSLHSEMFSILPMSLDLATKMLPTLAAVASKEASEVALNSEAAVLTRCSITILQSEGNLDKVAIDVFVKGITDKKATTRRLWALHFADVLWSIGTIEGNQGAQMLAEAVIPGYLILWSEVNTNPLSSAQSGLVPAAVALTAIASSKLPSLPGVKITAALKKAQVSQKALVCEPKPSFLLNPRIYSRFTSDDDFLWLIRALVSTSPNVLNSGVGSNAVIAWSQVFIFCICSTMIKPLLRRQAVEALSQVYVLHPADTARVITTGIWNWIQSVEDGDANSAALLSKSNNVSFNVVIQAICMTAEERSRLDTSIDQEVLSQQMVSLVVLCRPELLPRTSWIQLCLRVKIDPGDLCRGNTDALLAQITQNTEFENENSSNRSEAVKAAAYSAAAELAFIEPEVMTPRVIEMIKRDLDATDLASVSHIDAAILRTPEGTAFVDVLAKKGQTFAPNKNVKDYDTLKWEEDLRAQLAQKKGQARKLTPEENAKVNAQLAKEAEIRLSLKQMQAKLLRGFGIIKCLALGPPTEAENWMGPVIKALLSVITSGAGLITGDTSFHTYMACAERVSTRIGALRASIGVATLRALDVAYVPEAYTEKPLAELVTTVLYRLRFSGEQRPFDTVSLIYILPLILVVLQKGGFGSQEEADSHVVLALEFLSFHTDSCSDLALPRTEILSILIYSMQSYNQHYKIIKECLMDYCRCIAPNIHGNEISILARGAIVPQVSVRSSILQSISAEIDMSDLEFSAEIWIACHDDIDDNVELAQEIWEESDFTVTPDSAIAMLPYLNSADKQARRAAARALADSVTTHPTLFVNLIERLEKSYILLAQLKKPQLDEYGMPLKTDLSDPWEARNGIALAFKELAASFNEGMLDSFVNFLIHDGPLGDRNSYVRDEMVESATSIINIHGGSKVEDLMATFESTLEAPDQGSEFGDRVNEAVIILYGALARHLDVGDSRIPLVVERLLTTLSTPSETVQYAVAECLPPLVRASSEKSSDYVQRVLNDLFTSKKYAARRGSAYGLAGIVQGRGLTALREYRVLSALKNGAENKKDVNQREGALLAYELLSTILGRIFEPYVIQVVPLLLASFGDSSADVREACLAAAKTCFARLSSFGVKQILPTLLEGLDDQQWRTKKGACDLLGAMAYLDPQQLAQSLPEIIPPLTGVLNDSHKEVRLAANRSLKRFGEVISNPEIKSLVDILLKALSDATKYTDDALDALIKVSFVHYLDAPSLALVVRILERGLGDRSATKRKAAQVIGSLAHLTERKDLISHLPILVAGLKIAVVDPVPTTRATGSKALGSLVEKLGEDALPDLIPGLMQTLKSDTGAGDRLGSAQALSEVLAGLGTSRLEETLPSILQNVSSSKSSVREGFMSLFIFLPVCFGNSFANYLSKIIPPILSGLADEVESIRETSLRAGRLLVKNFATRAIDLLLPELERGLADDNYRIRLSSVELVGDLLFNLTGISASTEQDDVEEGANEAGASLLEVLGEDKRNKVLSSLYICRCDTSGLVRTAAVNVWKALVASPRTLKELVPTLTQLIIRRLGSSNMEQKVIAGNALGELIRKAGDGVLATLLPTLEEGLQISTDSDAKQGICIALKELISSASTEALEDHEKTLISVVRAALIDSDEDVREAAADAFDSLQQIFGKQAVDQVLPHLLSLLRTEGEADNALSALLTLLTETTRSNIILPNLIPTLTASPISSFNAKALASLSTVAGSAMTRRLPTILNALMDNMVACKDANLKAELDASFDAVVLSIDEYDGLNTTMSVLLALAKHDDHRRRAATAYHMAKFFSSTDVDYSRYNQDIIRVLLFSFDDRDTEVIKAAWTALSEFTKCLRKEEMETLVHSTRQILQHVGVAGHNLPGFGLPKGINAILPIFLQGLMNGTAEQKTQSALAISDIVDRTSPESLKPFVTQITGPLIRIVSERSVDVKAAILLTLNNLLEKIPTFLKPFLPQLQRTFAKSLADTSSEILRARAAKALGTLITMTPRVDPLIAELVTGSKTSDSGVRTAMLKALYEVISKAGANMSETSKSAVLSLIDTDLEDDSDSMAITHARLLGALIKNVSPENASSLVKHRVLSSHPTQSSVLALNAVLLDSPRTLTDSLTSDDLPMYISQGLSNKNAFIADNYVLAAGKYLLAESAKNFDAIKPLFESLAAAIQPGSPVDTRRLALVVIRTLCRRQIDLIKPHVPILAPPIFASVRDLVIPVKLAAEAAFVALFNVVEDESKVFDKYMAGPGAELPPNTKRSMQDYFKRIALRLGNQARERREAEGGQGGLGLSNDEVEDEREIWSVGKVDLGDGVFNND